MFYRIQWHSLHDHPSLALEVCPPAHPVWALYILLLYLCLDCYWHISRRDFYIQADQLQGMTMTNNHWLLITVEDQPTQQSRTYFNGALVPTESVPSMCCLWKCLSGGVSMWSEAVHWVLALGLQERYRSRLFATCILPGATQHELQSVLQVDAAYVGLGGAQVRPQCEPKPAAAIVSLGPLTERYGVSLNLFQWVAILQFKKTGHFKVPLKWVNCYLSWLLEMCLWYIIYLVHISYLVDIRIQGLISRNDRGPLWDENQYSNARKHSKNLEIRVLVYIFLL